MPKKQIKLPTVTQLPSGAYHTRCMVSGERISITGDSEKEVIAKYMAMKGGVIEAQRQEKAKVKTLETAVREYIDSRRDYRSPSTIYGYERTFKNTFQTMMQANVYTVTDEQWQQAIRREKALGHSPKYISNAWALIAASIKEATGRRPNVLLYQKEPKERIYLEPDQIDILVAALKGHRMEIPALLCLSSLRRSELMALTWDKVDLDKKTIDIHGARVRGETGYVEKAQNKTSKSRRTIPIIPPLQEALEACPDKTGKVVRNAPDVIIKHLRRLCAEVGLPPIDLHGLRHSFASLAYHLQIPEMIAAEIGGWDDLATMRKIYTHLSQKDIAKRAQDFSNYFDSKSQIGNGIGNGK